MFSWAKKEDIYFYIFFGLKKLKKPPQKVAYLVRNSVVSEIFHLLPTYCPTAQMAEFMFQNVVYRATVYRTGTDPASSHHEATTIGF